MSSENNSSTVLDEEDEEDEEEKQQSSASSSSAISTKCEKCGKKARKGCTLGVCVKCCTDLENCQVHKEQREQAEFRRQVKEGTTPIQLQAKEYRTNKCLQSNRLRGFFREPGFAYMGDTVVIWNLRAYLKNPKWKEDALRKSLKRRARQEQRDGGKCTVIRNSPKRFRRIMEELYEKNRLKHEEEATS